MHAGIKQARQDEALATTARAVQETSPRLDRIEAKLDQALELLQQLRAAQQSQKGGR
jgi:uncharacterized coiled-coil protein SlyX